MVPQHVLLRGFAFALAGWMIRGGAACASSEVSETPFDDHYTVTRLYPDERTSFGAALTDEPAFANIVSVFDQILCRRPVSCLDPDEELCWTPIVIHTVGLRKGSFAEGSVRLLIGDRNGADLCSSSTAVSIDPISDLVDVSGPMFSEGLRADARIDGSAISAFSGLFDEWFSLTAELSPESYEVDRGQLVGRWSTSFLFEKEVSPPEQPSICSGSFATALDVAVIGAAIQPDDDADGDGLEEFLDCDGDCRVDVCVDGGFEFSCGDSDGGDGVVHGESCPASAQFNDGYFIRLEYKVTPVEAE